ncbi:MAG: GAF domain-containing protein [Planctomycetota bacterium]
MTQTLLAAAELWQPNASSNLFDFQSGFYGDCEALRGVPAQSTIALDQGPLGQVAATGQPMILDDLSELGFLVEEAAKTHSLAAAVLVPAYLQGEVESVLVMYFRRGVEAKAAIELWAGTKGRFELSLDQYYYAGLERFSRISQYVNFPMGAGLPGQIWETALPGIVPDLATAKGFLRSSGAESDGLSVGLGIPVMRRTDLRSVLLLLSSEASPIARVHEIWVEDPEKPGTLTRSMGVYGGHAELAEASKDLAFSVSSKEGLPGQAWALGKPLLLDGVEAMGDAGMKRVDAVRAAGLSYALAWPTIVVDRVRAVVLLMG